MGNNNARPPPPLLQRCPKTDFWCETKLESRKVSYIWKLENFSLREEKIGEFINSHIFSAYGENKIKWSLKLYPNGFSNRDQDFLTLFLYLEDSDRREIRANYKLAIIDGKGLQSHVISSSHFFQVTKTWNTEKHRLISKPRLNDNLLPNDTLTILCEVTYGVNKGTVSGRRSWLSWIPKLFKRKIKVKSNQNKNQMAKQSMVQQISELFYEPKYSDVILDVRGQEFKAHKLILRVRSPVFAAMFEHQMKENQNNRVLIKDISPQVFREMLRFIYSGENYTLNEDMSAELLSAADQYELLDLKSICEESLSSMLTIETVCNYLILADMHSAEELKAKSIAFIKSNSDQVLKSEGWKQVSKNAQILNQCLSAFA